MFRLSFSPIRILLLCSLLLIGLTACNDDDDLVITPPDTADPSNPADSSDVDISILRFGSDTFVVTGIVVDTFFDNNGYATDMTILTTGTTMNANGIVEGTGVYGHVRLWQAGTMLETGDYTYDEQGPHRITVSTAYTLDNDVVTEELELGPGEFGYYGSVYVDMDSTPQSIEFDLYNGFYDPVQVGTIFRLLVTGDLSTL